MTGASDAVVGSNVMVSEKKVLLDHHMLVVWGDLVVHWASRSLSSVVNSSNVYRTGYFSMKYKYKRRLHSKHLRRRGTGSIRVGSTVPVELTVQMGMFHNCCTSPLLTALRKTPICWRWFPLHSSSLIYMNSFPVNMMCIGNLVIEG